MNAVEIDEALSDLASAPFDPAEFPYAFLRAFGVKETTIARLRKGETNASDVGGVLQRTNIHIAVAEPGAVGTKLRALRESPKTALAKAKFVLATDGEMLEAEDLVSGEPLATTYRAFAEHFGFFLPLAGISTIKEIKNNPIDVKATGRLNRLYVELLKNNPDWGSPERRHDLNQFMARLIFCFFAEDTGIFNGTNLFTSTIERMSTTEAGSVEHVLTELFRSMDIKPDDRAGASLRPWADAFPYVNGGLFAGGKPCPQFSKIARSYLLRAGELNWKEINPDIFGSMIQAVADEEERASLGQHYTSVPNIMKVLGPLFLDDLKAQLEAAGDNVRKLRNLRKRLARIRVFDPACGSGNFLVIAYIRMREIENEIVKFTDDEPRSVIPLANFFGIEIKDFAAEIARLALLIAEFQCDVRFINQQVARSLVLPLKRTGEIRTGNALREVWERVCPLLSEEKSTFEEHELTGPTGRLKFDDEHDGNAFETYICGNPPYKGRNKKAEEERVETELVFNGLGGSFASLDYVANWFFKAAKYCKTGTASAAFVATNSICQGEQVGLLWPALFAQGMAISFAHTSFKWSNLASDKAGVTVAIVGISERSGIRKLYSGSEVRTVSKIGPYLVPNTDTIVKKRVTPLSCLENMYLGNMAKDGGWLIMANHEGRHMIDRQNVDHKFIRPFYGSEEVIYSSPRLCLWIEEGDVEQARSNVAIKERLSKVEAFRRGSKAVSTQAHASTPHRFVQLSAKVGNRALVVPRVSSEKRPYLPVDYLKSGPIIGDKCYAVYDAPIWHLSIIASKMHIIWIGTVCSRLEMRFSYGNTLGWNTFPLPILTEEDRQNLSVAADNILIAREEHFPATIADLYEPDCMPENLRRAHEINDEILERIFIGRRFRNDTERLEKLFELYTKMTETEAKSGKKPASRGRRQAAAGAA